jgi:hypothetical protein
MHLKSYLLSSNNLAKGKKLIKSIDGNPKIVFIPKVIIWCTPLSNNMEAALLGLLYLELDT